MIWRARIESFYWRMRRISFSRRFKYKGIFSKMKFRDKRKYIRIIFSPMRKKF